MGTHVNEKRACAGVTMVALVCLAGGAWAAPISYAEIGVIGGTDPDLANTVPATDLGDLDVGTNTVRGRIVALCTNAVCSPNDQHDFFAVHLPVGLQITVGTLEVIQYNTIGQVQGLARDFDVYTPWSFNFTFNSVGVLGLPGLPAGGPGDLVFDATGSLTAPPDNNQIGLGVEYLWSLTVAPESVGEVPEPGTLPLVGLIVAGLLVTSRIARHARLDMDDGEELPQGQAKR
jgi:hypothetical protein